MNVYPKFSKEIRTGLKRKFIPVFLKSKNNYSINRVIIIINICFNKLQLLITPIIIIKFLKMMVSFAFFVQKCYNLITYPLPGFHSENIIVYMCKLIVINLIIKLKIINSSIIEKSNTKCKITITLSMFLSIS